MTQNLNGRKSTIFPHCVEKLLKYLFHKGMNVIVSNCKKSNMRKVLYISFCEKKKNEFAGGVI